jgi:hypothetical protein
MEKNCDALPKIDSGIPHTTRSNMHSINFLDKSPKKGNQVWQTINFDENQSQILNQVENSKEYFTSRSKSIRNEFEKSSFNTRQMITNLQISNRLKNINKNRH